jgi:hypothetical protein
MSLPHVYASAADLPPELHPFIVQNVYKAHDLMTASLVSSEWRKQAHKHLFSTLWLPDSTLDLRPLSDRLGNSEVVLAAIRTIGIPCYSYPVSELLSKTVCGSDDQICSLSLFPIPRAPSHHRLGK